jgi:tellurite resistance protein
VFATLDLSYTGGMEPHVDAIVKALVAVAWADGRIAKEEQDVFEALLGIFQLGPEDTATIREYAKTPRTLDDVPLTDLSAEDRKLLLQHAVVITYVDGEQSPDEAEFLQKLVSKLHIPAEEAQTIIAGADKRAQRLLSLL